MRPGVYWMNVLEKIVHYREVKRLLRQVFGQEDLLLFSFGYKTSWDFMEAHSDSLLQWKVFEVALSAEIALPNRFLGLRNSAQRSIQNYSLFFSTDACNIQIHNQSIASTIVAHSYRINFYNTLHHCQRGVKPYFNPDCEGQERAFYPRVKTIWRAYEFIVEAIQTTVTVYKLESTKFR